ncbi:MAG: ferritin family protein [Nitrospirota bacterium]|jgi:rubrerythrin
MAKFSTREAIEMAVQTERLGYQFYNEMAEKFKDHEGLSDLFRRLALKEKSHEAVFTRLRDQAAGQDVEQPDEVAHYMRAMVESEFFIGKEKSLPSMDKVKTLGDAVDYAMGFEKETLLFFVGLRSMLADGDSLDAVINEERSHIAWLSEFKGKL